MRTGNPALSDEVFHDAAREYSHGQSMTLQGTVLKTGVLLCILVAAVGFTWTQTHPKLPSMSESRAQGESLPVSSNTYNYMLVGLLGGFVVSLITIFNPRVSPYTAPLYAALEGVALGG